MSHENDRKPTDERDTIARLVRAAGKRAPASEVGTRRARAAAREVWHGTVRRNRVRRAWLAASSVAAAALIVLAVVTRQAEREIAFVPAPILVEAVIGEVLLERGDAPREALAPGRALSGALALSTSRSGRAAVRLASGHSLRLDGESLVRLGAGGEIDLVRGALYVSSPSRSARVAPLEVRTPLGSIQEIGTQFEARLVDRALRVRLREGEVVLRHGAQEQRVGAGSELTLREDGSIDRAPIAAHDAEWDWTLSAAPLIDIEGKTALDFLEWCARERGLELVFSDEGSRAHAARTVLSGRAGSLGMERALDAVLPAAALDYRIEDGRLYVSARRR